ncbi:hypothetical protein DL763_007513 [Monosporascus cannonballus]|nr:hypothetical protein DL763_007513 [Monosporascus cannonballus]
MKTSVFATFSLAIGLAASVKIPEDAPDRLFVASLDKRDENYGNFTLLARHVPSAAGPAIPNKHSARLAPRYTPLPISRKSCSPDTYVDPSDFSRSRGELASQCNAGMKIGGNSLPAYKASSSAAYACSYGEENPCGEDEIDAVFSEINKNCGS